MGISFAIIKVCILTLAIVLPLLIVITRRLRHGSVMMPSSGIVFAALMLPIAYGLSALFASDRNTALLGFNFNTDSLIIITLGVLSLILTIIISVHKGVAESLRKGVIYISGATIVFFLVQVFIQLLGVKVLTSFGFMQLVGSWLDIAALGGLLVIFLLTTHKVNSEATEKVPMIHKVLVTGLMLFLGIFTNITLVFVLLAAVAGLMLAIAMRESGRDSLMTIGILPVIVLVASSVFIIDNTLLNAKISNTIQGWTKVSFIDVRPNWQGTLDVAKGTVMESGMTTKLFGPGAGSFAEQWRMHKPVGVNITQFWSTNFTNAIGFIPTSVITGGAVVFAVWLVFLIAVLWTVVRSRGSALGLATLFMWIFAILNPVDTLVLIIAFVITGLFIVEMARVRSVRMVNYRLRGEDINKLIAFVFVPVVIIASIGSLLVVAHRSIVNGYLIKASEMMIAGNMNDAEILLNKSKKLTDVALIEQGYTRVALAQLSTLLQVEEGSEAEVDQEAVQAALANVLAHAQRAIERDPQNPVNYTALGNISEQLISLNVEGAAESALAAYTQAAALDPKNPSIPFAMARIYGAMEDVEGVTKALETSLALKGNYEPALYQYGLLKLSEQDTETAIQALGTVVQINQNNANALYYLSLALAQEDRIEEAIVVMQRVAILNPENEDVKQIVDALTQQVSGAGTQVEPQESDTLESDTLDTETLKETE